MGRSTGNTRGISDSRECALGGVENRLERNSKGDLRKTLSHPHSLAAPGGPAGSACQTQCQGLARKTNTFVQGPVHMLLLVAAAARPAGNSAANGAGGRSPVSSRSRPGTQTDDGCSLWMEKMQLYGTLLTLSSSWHVKERHCCCKNIQKQEINFDFFPF